MYSGVVAGAVYSRVHVPQTAILVGPNHTGYGPPVSIFDDGEWVLPGAVIPVAAELALVLRSQYPPAEPDHLAHLSEHSLEMQLPFLCLLRPDIRILPIVIGLETLDACLDLGRALAAVVKGEKLPPLLIASTDLTHCGLGFEQNPPPGLTAAAFAQRQDQLALEALQTLDARSLYETVRANAISMCGYAPTTAVLYAARLLGATRAELIRYATSADVDGEVQRAVGYGGLMIT